MQSRSRKRLDFTAGSSSRKPFKGSVFYLDLSEHPKQAKTLEKELKILGGAVSSFLSKDANISYVVTAQKDVTSKLTDVANTTGSPLLSNRGGLCSPATPGDSPSPLSCDAVPGSGAPLTYVRNTRAQKILQKATHGTKLATASRRDIVSMVKDWDGVKVVSLERVLRIVEKHRHLISGDAISQSNLVAQCKSASKTSETHVHQLQAPYIKVEDRSCKYRPLYLELTTWPRPDFNSSPGSCPFESSDKGPYVVPIEQSNRVRLRLSENRKKRKSSEKATEQPAAAKQEEPEAKKANEVAGGWKRKGYCECCGLKFDCLNTHLTSSQHIKFAADSRNYKELDELIQQAKCSLNDYLAQLSSTQTRGESSASPTPETPCGQPDTARNEEAVRLPTPPAEFLGQRRSRRRRSPADATSKSSCFSPSPVKSSPCKQAAELASSGRSNRRSPITDDATATVAVAGKCTQVSPGAVDGKCAQASTGAVAGKCTQASPGTVDGKCAQASPGTVDGKCAQAMPSLSPTKRVSAEQAADEEARHQPDHAPAPDDESRPAKGEQPEINSAVNTCPSTPITAESTLSQETSPARQSPEQQRSSPNSKSSSRPTRKRKRPSRFHVKGKQRSAAPESLSFEVVEPSEMFVAPQKDADEDIYAHVRLLPSSPAPQERPPRPATPDGEVKMANTATPTRHTAADAAQLDNVLPPDVHPPLPKESPPRTPPAPKDSPGGSPPLRRSSRHSSSPTAWPLPSASVQEMHSALVFSPVSRKRSRSYLKEQYSPRQPAQPHSALLRTQFAVGMSSPRGSSGFHIADFTSSPGLVDQHQQAVSRAFIHLEESSSCESDLPVTPRRHHLRKRRRLMSSDSPRIPAQPPLPTSVPPPQPPLPPPPFMPSPLRCQPPLPTSPPQPPPPPPATSPPKLSSPPPPREQRGRQQSSKRRSRHRDLRRSSSSSTGKDLGIYSFTEF